MAAPSLLYPLPRPQDLGELLERLGFTLILDHELHVTGQRPSATDPRARLVIGFGRPHKAAEWHGVALHRADGYDVVADTPGLGTLPDVEAWLLGVIG